MMLDHFEARAIYDERLREAALERRASQLRAQRPKTSPRYLSHLKARAGDSLIALGHRLKRENELVYGYGRR